MSVTYFSYDDRLKWKDNVGVVWASGLQYIKDSSIYITNPRGIDVNLRPNATGPSDPLTEISVFKYSNGCELKVLYRLYVTQFTGGQTYHLETCRAILYDKNGVELISSSFGVSNRNYIITNPIPPFSDVKFVPGLVIYGDNDPSIIGETAQQVWFGTFYIKNHTQLTPVPFTEDEKLITYQNTWERFFFLLANNDADYDRYLNLWLSGGDGSDPHDVSPGGGGGGGGTPAGGDDTSNPGGGDGNYDDTSDPIDFPDLPTGGALECGALVAHRVSKQALTVIFTKLWDLTLINTWLKSLEDPMDAIVSLHALPVSPNVENDPNNIFIGNLDMGISTPIVTSQYVEVDCGSLTLNEFWGSALDYSPYTRIEIYLPFIGMRTLRTEDVMKSTLAIKYYVDVLTGDCIAFIKCGISVLYTFNGNCKMSIPLSSRSTDALQKILVATGLAIAGGSVAVGGGAAAAAATKAPQIAAAGLTSQAANMQAGSLMLSGAANIASTKINVSRSGDVSGSVGIMGEYIPYLIIHRPVQSLAKDYNKFKGYTANLTKKLGDLSGYTEVEHINLQGIPNATADEMAEIKSLLTSGVIF